MKKIIAIVLTLALLLTFASCGKKDEEAKDTYTEGGVTVSTELFPENTEIKVEKLKAEDEKYGTVKTALPNAVKLDAYEITAESDGVKVQPDGTALVTFPIPDTYDSAKHNVEVYYVSDDGETEKVTATLKDGGVVAELMHFSTYVVVLTVKENTSGSNEISSGESKNEITDKNPNSPSGSDSKEEDKQSNNQNNKNEVEIDSKPKAPTITDSEVQKLFDKFNSASLCASNKNYREHGPLYNANLNELDDLTAISFIFRYCSDEFEKFKVSGTEFPTWTAPKAYLDQLAKKHLGYIYDFAKSYTLDDYVIEITYDSSSDKVTFTEMGGGMGSPDGFKVMSYKQSEETLIINLRYHEITEGTPTGTEGVDFAKSDYEGAYYKLTDSATLTYKYVDDTWRIISFK